MEGSKVDNGAVDRGDDTAGGVIHQNRGEGDGGAAHQTPGRTPPVCGHPGLVSVTTTRDHPGEHHQRHGGRGVRTTIQSSRVGGGGLGEPPSLAPRFW